MLLVCDSHPIQYKVPVYRSLAWRLENDLHVLYASDCSIRGYRDPGFGRDIAWDRPLTEGYESTVLNTMEGVVPSGFFSLTGSGVGRVIAGSQPSACLLSQLLYRYDIAAIRECRRRGIPIILRQETQDESMSRSGMKAWIRSQVYRQVYKRIDRFCYIGDLNRRHYESHGVSSDRLIRSPYCVDDQVSGISDQERRRRREQLRESHEVGNGDRILLFCGKLTRKKGVDLFLEALRELGNVESGTTRCIHAWVVGSGPEEGRLRDCANNLGLPVRFHGFVNQSNLPDYYLAADVAVVPSRRMGETWGLVVNEALHAGCAVVMSNAVGCHPEFEDWERVYVFPEEDVTALAAAVRSAVEWPRDFDWCRHAMQAYSVEAAADGIERAYRNVTGSAKD